MTTKKKQIMQDIQLDELLFVRKSYRNADDGPFLLQRDSSTPSYYRSASCRVASPSLCPTQPPPCCTSHGFYSACIHTTFTYGVIFCRMTWYII